MTTRSMEVLEGYIALQRAGIPDHLCYAICKMVDDTCFSCKQERASSVCEVCRRKVCRACSTVQTVFSSGLRRRVCRFC